MLTGILSDEKNIFGFCGYRGRTAVGPTNEQKEKKASEAKQGFQAHESSLGRWNRNRQVSLLLMNFALMLEER